MRNSIYNEALERIVLPIGDRIEGGSFVSWLSKYRHEQWLNHDELKQIQSERLLQMLRYARSNIPFYENIDIDGDPFETVLRFPIVSKTEINAHVDMMVTQPKSTLLSASGSGSSGIQGTVYMNKSAKASARAMQLLWFEWSGYRVGDRILQTGITHRRGFVKRTKDLMLKTQYVPAFNLDAREIENILSSMGRGRPEYLFGYASSLHVLAGTALDIGITDVKFKHAVSWGDKLFPHYRKTIREAFGCETLDTYGCTEGAMIGAECVDGSFHLAINQCYVEIVDDDGRPVPPGTMGKVLVTRLDNFAMPLIRYYLGDLAELEPEDGFKCECGRSLPRLRRVIGRDTDIVRTRSGKHMIVHFFTGIFEHVPQIRQFKVVQENLDSVQIHYISGPDFDPAVLERIERTINGYLKENMRIVWVRTDNIKPTGSGKPQIIQSFIEQPLSHFSSAVQSRQI